MPTLSGTEFLQVLDFDTFFDGNLAANLVALGTMFTEESSSHVSNNIYIVP